MKKKVYFLAPKNRGGTYFYYLGIFKYLKEKHGDEFDFFLCNSFLSYLKLHFIRADYIFSIIPFVFKPLFTYKYIYNLHGNYKVERKSKGIGVKLLYLTELNLMFSDKIMLTSNYLADVLNFSDLELQKTIILQNYIREKTDNLELNINNNFKFLTVTSFDFRKKGDGVINLLNVIQRLGKEKSDENICFTIVGNAEGENYKRVYEIYKNMIFSKNITIKWTGWLSKEELEKNFFLHNTFLYWSLLDNTPGVLFEAMNYKRKIYVNDFESFSYILPAETICINEDMMLRKILEDVSCSNKYNVVDINVIGKRFYSFIK